VALRGYGPELLGYLRAIVRTESDAAEVFAAVSEALWKGLPRFRRECTFRTWLYMLALNAARRHERDPYRRRGRRLATDEVSKLVAEVSSRTPVDASARTRSQVERLRAQLSRDENTLLILRVDRGMTWAEVGRVLARRGRRPLDEAALRKRFERLKVKLRELARAEGIRR
jgi:RNA polymerase sigma-70 factor, ECF subfamily